MNFSVVGHLAAAGHGIAGAITGDDDHLQRARRACGTATKSTLVTAGTVGGALVAGPFGAMAGATVGSIGGQCAEKGINHANDKKFQTSAGTYDNFNAADFAVETAADAVRATKG